MGVLVIPGNLNWRLQKRENGRRGKACGDHGHLRVAVSRVPSATHTQALHIRLYLLICSMGSGPICLEKLVVPLHRPMAKSLGYTPEPPAPH